MAGGAVHFSCYARTARDTSYLHQLEAERLWGRALWVFDRMVCGRTRPDTEACSVAMRAAGSGRVWRRAVGLAAGMLNTGTRVDVGAFASAASAATLGGRWQVSLRLVKECAEADKGRQAASAAWAKGRHWRRALCAVATPDGSWCTTSNAAVLSAYTTGAQWRRALSVCPHDLGTGHAASAAVASCGMGLHWQGALALLERCPPGVSRDTRGLCGWVCLHASRWRVSLGILHSARPRTRGDSLLVLDVHRWVGHWRQAIGFVAASPADHFRDPQVVSLCVAACRLTAEWEAALRVFSRTSRGARANTAVVSSALSAMKAGALWRECLGLIDGSSDVSDKELSAAMSACGRAGKWEEALGLLHLRGGLEAVDYVSLTAARQGCTGVFLSGLREALFRGYFFTKGLRPPNPDRPGAVGLFYQAVKDSRREKRLLYQPRESFRQGRRWGKKGESAGARIVEISERRYDEAPRRGGSDFVGRRARSAQDILRTEDAAPASVPARKRRPE
eukprot:Hpha_TRINITY_DN16584_c1_g4::TRINITY_DN16584_c1_g4_i1::g.132878::m.132878